MMVISKQKTFHILLITSGFGQKKRKSEGKRNLIIKKRDDRGNEQYQVLKCNKFDEDIYLCLLIVFILLIVLSDPNPEMEGQADQSYHQQRNLMLANLRLPILVLFLLIPVDVMFTPYPARTVDLEANFQEERIVFSGFQVAANAGGGTALGTDFELSVAIDGPLTVNAHSLFYRMGGFSNEVFTPASGTISFDAPSSHEEDPFNINTNAGSPADFSGNLQFQLRLDPDELSVGSTTYTISIDDTASGGPNGPLQGTETARNHQRRVFYFSLNEGEIARVSHDSSSTILRSNRGGGNSRTPQFSFFSGAITTVAGLAATPLAGPWTSDTSPQIPIPTTQTYTLLVEINNGIARSGQIVDLKLEVGINCGNRQLNIDEECDNGGNVGCRFCIVEAGYNCNEVDFLEETVCESVCGNAIRTPEQQCDTGGDTDGCVGCMIVPGYDCNQGESSTSICEIIPGCGNNLVEEGEQCDNANGHGCSSDCVPDQGFECTGSPSVCQNCGNGMVQGTEPCDNGGMEGCSTGCTVDFGYVCTGSPSECEYRANCNNAIKEQGQNCDNGPSDEPDGCSDACTVERDFKCFGEEGMVSDCRPLYVCGNGIYEPYNDEHCDTGDAPGCTAQCRLEPGWRCFNEQNYTSVCASVCGNGIRQAIWGEQCDDGDLINGNGCSDICELEENWRCPPEGGQCEFIGDLPPCGNEILEVELGEQCDDGNNNDGDGCSSMCKNEVIIDNTCGDGRLQSDNEDCDDGNGIDQDGCNNDCTFTQNYYCYFNVEGYRSACSHIEIGNCYAPILCGNGCIQAGQQCDDGWPLQNGDGCSTTCQLQDQDDFVCRNFFYLRGITTRCWRI